MHQPPWLNAAWTALPGTVPSGVRLNLKDGPCCGPHTRISICRQPADVCQLRADATAAVTAGRAAAVSSCHGCWAVRALPLLCAGDWRALHAQGRSKSLTDAYCFHDIMASCPEQGRSVTIPPVRPGCRSNTGAGQQWKTGPGHGCTNHKPLSLLTGALQQASAGAFGP